MADTPPPEALTLRQRFHARFVEMAREHASTPRLAAGVGIGAFIGTSPLIGFHALVGVAVARLLRLNQIAVFAGTNVSFGPLVPVLAFGSIQIGHRLLAGSWLHLAVEEMTLELAQRTLGAWVLGSAVLGAALGLGAAALTVVVVGGIRRARARVDG